MGSADLIFLPLSLFIGHYIINRVVEKHRIPKAKSLLTKLFYYHIFFSLVFSFYIISFGGDADNYWGFPVRFMLPWEPWFVLHKTGTPFVFFLTYPFTQNFDISFIVGNIMFSLFGFGGFIYLFLICLKYIPFNPAIFGYKLFPLILFLPNMHFWSAGIGKDAVIFFTLCGIIYAATNPKNNILLIAVCFYLAFFIRPHIALLMVVGFGAGLLFSSKGASPFWRITFLAIAIGGFILIAPTVIDFVGLEQESLESFEDVSQVRAGNLSRSRTGSAINISDLSVPLKMFTFLFRPLFFDSVNVFGVIVSIENLLYFLMFIAMIRFRNIRVIIKMPVFLKASFFILFSAAFFLSSSMGNLGIIIRQKNMVMFMFVLIALYVLGIDQNKNKIKKMGKYQKRDKIRSH